MKVLVYGDIYFDRIYSSLIKHFEEIIVIASRPPEKDYSSSDVVVWIDDLRIPNETIIQQYIDKYKPDYVIPRIRGTENEQSLVAHSSLAQKLSQISNKIIYDVHPYNFSVISTDKVELAEYAIKNNIRVPQTICFDSYIPSEFEIYSDLGQFPIILKQAISNSCKSVYVINNYIELTETIKKNITGRYLIQEYITGEEIGIEIVTRNSKSYRFPTAYLGLVESINPQSRIRKAPYKLEPNLNQQITKMIDTFEYNLQPNGSWQMDLIVKNDIVYLLEINARNGGLSNLSFESTGSDPNSINISTIFCSSINTPIENNIVFEIPVSKQIPKINIKTEDFKAYTLSFRSQEYDKLIISSSNTIDIISFLNNIQEEYFALEKNYCINEVRILINK